MISTALFFNPLILGAILGAPLITVCPKNCDFTSLPQAVQSAAAGATIVVKGGQYKLSESINIAKQLTLIGEDTPQIIGDGQNDVILIKSSGVSIEGFSIENSGYSYLHEIAAIRIEDVADCKISGNQVRSEAYGIYLANIERCSVSGNTIRGSYHSESESGNGIHSWNSRKLAISGNRVSGHRDGIYLEFTADSTVETNIVGENIRYGLHFMTAHRNVYRGNRFERNGAGVAVMYSRDVRMLNNIFANNRGMAAYGLLLKDISAGDISGNTFSDNTFGVYMEGTNRSKLTDNDFNDNGHGLRIFGDCDDNVISLNNFSGNTFDVVTNSSRNPNTFSQNYWSHYSGYDLGDDLIGDIPYRPVSLSSVIVERLDATFVLINSPLLLLFDQIEQAFPLLIPESLKDEQPMMQPWKRNS